MLSTAQFKTDLIQELINNDDYMNLDRINLILDKVLNGYNIEYVGKKNVESEITLPLTIQLYIKTKTLEGFSQNTLKFYERFLNLFFTQLKKSQTKLLLLIYVFFYLIIRLSAKLA